MSAAAYRCADRLIDARTYTAIACDPSRSAVIEACAGAGKTWLLVSRIVRALLSGAAPQEVLAITFTRKAAGEIRARLAEWLAEWAAPGCAHAARVAALRERGLSPGDAERLAPTLAGLHERWAAQGRGVEVHTFHGWFTQLLRGAPMAALESLGLQPDVTPIESVEEHAVEVRRRFHRRLLADPALREDHTVLVAERGRSQTAKWIELAWAKRVEIERAGAAGTLFGSVPAAAQVWPEFTAFGATPAQRLRVGDADQLLRQVAGDLQRAIGKLANDAGAQLATALAIADDLAALRAARVALFTKDGDGEPRKKMPAPDVDAAVDLLDRVQRACHQEAAHHEHERVARLALAMLEEYAAYKRERRLVDMPDLEQCALRLLDEPELAGWIQERLDTRVRHLLIDEFQDTSPLQWHALYAWLSSYAGAGGGASGQAPPSVFIVGDPKQSIYRFRRAEPRVFAEAQAFVVDALDGQRLSCDHTRRCAPEVVDALNRVFDEARTDAGHVGVRPHTTDRHAHAPLAAVWRLPYTSRPEGTKSGGIVAPTTWRDTLTTPRDEPETVLRQQEAAHVADAIADLVHGQQVPPGEIMVLARTRSPLAHVADALALRRVPFAAAEKLLLRESPEARDVIAVLDALASPGNTLALAHTLRCPLFGASDDDLLAVAAEARAHGRWWPALATVAATPGASEALVRAAALLPAWAAAARHLPPHDLLDRIVAEGDWTARLAAAVVPERRAGALATLDAVVALSLSLDGGRRASLYALVRALKAPTLELPPTVQPGAVQLLTIHGAKGLEARVVVMVDTDAEPKLPATPSLLVDWPPDALAPRRCAFVYSEAEARCPHSLRSLLAEENAARDREELNALYVAMTRAEDRLLLSATEPSRRAARSRTWWERVQWVPDMPVAQAAIAPPAGWQRATVSANATLRTLPVWNGTVAALRAAPQPPVDDTAARLGQAIHLALQWSAPTSLQPAPAASLEALATAAADGFAVDAAAVRRAVEAVWRGPAGRRFFDRAAWVWAANEHVLLDGDDVLRIDRLVQLADAAGTWWVLDHKLHRAPLSVPGHVAQLQRYCDLVQRRHPGHPVRGAFISATGEVTPLAADVRPQLTLGL